MVQFEYFPQLIESHRNDLRRLAHPLPPELGTPSWRHAIGLRLVQLGRWVEGNRPLIAGDPAAMPGPSTGAA